MATPQNLLSTNIMEWCLKGAAEDVFGAHNLVGHIHAGHPSAYKHASAMFEKEGPGRYAVYYYRDGKKVAEEVHSSVIASKLSVLSYLVAAVKETPEAAIEQAKKQQRELQEA